MQRVDLDLTRTTFWIGDERCVDPEDDRSNYKMIKESLLDPLGDRAPRFERMKGELGPEEGAADYEQRLRDAAGRRSSTSCCWGSGPTATARRCSPGRRR